MAPEKTKRKSTASGKRKPASDKGKPGMPGSRPCPSACGFFLSAADTHKACPMCLGMLHAKAALASPESCKHCSKLRPVVRERRVALLTKVFGNSSSSRDPLLSQTLTPTAELELDEMDDTGVLTWGDQMDLLHCEEDKDGTETRFDEASSSSPVMVPEKAKRKSTASGKRKPASDKGKPGMPGSRPCPSACGFLISAADTHEACPMCLGMLHAKAALASPESCKHCSKLRLVVRERRVALLTKAFGNSNSSRDPLLSQTLTPTVELESDKMDDTGVLTWGDQIDLLHCEEDKESTETSTENMETWALGGKRAGPPLSTTGPLRKRFKKKNPQYSADIVFTRGDVLQTVPSLSKLLKGVTGLIGLQYVWEYRSPSKTVQPHYLCKLCSLSCVQHDITDHVKGWKHCFKYMKKHHPDKITFEDGDVLKDPTLKGPLRTAAAEVERAEGRGQIRVILKEPFDVLAFKHFRSAIPKIGPPNQEIEPMGPSFGPRYHDSEFSGEFSHHGGPFTDYQEYQEPGVGGYMSRETFSGPDMDQGSFSDDMGQYLPRGGNGFGPGSGRAGYGRSGLQDESPSKMYPDKYQGNQMGDNFNDRPQERSEGMGVPVPSASSSSSLPNTLLRYLDTFQIENEADAQLVLKVTQKLTDVLMEYRLRSVSKGSNRNASMSGDDRYANNLSGPSRYADGPPRYYN